MEQKFIDLLPIGSKFRLTSGKENNVYILTEFYQSKNGYITKFKLEHGSKEYERRLTYRMLVIHV